MEQVGHILFSEEREHPFVKRFQPSSLSPFVEYSMKVKTLEWLETVA
jgi:hypothetical protein